MRVVIAGYGFVGQAVEQYIKEHCEVVVSDPNKNLHTSYFGADAVIICVATPQGNDGSCDMSNVLDALAETPIHAPVLIKSTISLEGWDQIKEHYPEHNITFSPEFLRAASAIEDFANQDYVYLGGKYEGAEFWTKFFRAINPSIVTEQLSPKEAILIKYFRNSFLATKVAFFNQVYDLCEKLDMPYYVVQRGINYDERIGKSHTEVTEERGFGGHCFPKDTSALLKSTEHYGADVLSILKEAVNYNNRLKNR